MKKVLITGGAGYIGSVTTDRLMGSGEFEIAIVDNLSTGNRKLINPKAKFYDSDLCDLKALKDIFVDFKPEVVVHFAGVSQVGESNENPEKYYKNNIVGGICLLKAMEEVGCKKIVFSSSAAVYGIPEKIPITESHGINPISVYGETKAIFEEVLKFYEKKNGLKFLALRYFNAGGSSGDRKYGEIHDPETHLIPNILKSLKKGGEFKLFGDDYKTKDGTCIRDYVHVEDLARAHEEGVKYLEGANKSECINLGSGSGYSVREIIEICNATTGENLDVRIEKRRPGDPETLVASYEKAERLLKWRPEKSIEDIIKNAWEFEKTL